MSIQLRVLVVEDEAIVAILIEDMLEELGHLLVGPAPRLDAGMKLAGTENVDLAILDVNLAGQKSFPIADVLIERGIPVIFATGYGRDGLDAPYGNFPVLAKPLSHAALAGAIENVRGVDRLIK